MSVGCRSRGRQRLRGASDDWETGCWDPNEIMWNQWRGRISAQRRQWINEASNGGWGWRDEAERATKNWWMNRAECENEKKWHEIKIAKWNETWWNRIKWNIMKWNEMRWNEMKWNVMKWNEVSEINDVTWNGTKSNKKMKWNRKRGMEWNEIERNGTERNGMEWMKQMKWNNMQRNETKWN